MKNLFIMHTQNNLILACGLALTDYKNDENHLILHAEFKLKPLLLSNLRNAFSKITVVQEDYYRKRNPLFDELHICKLMTKSKEYIGKDYDSVLLSEENYWDTLLLSKLGANKIINIEEDIYFPLSASGNLTGKVGFAKRLLRKIRSVERRCVFGKNEYYGTYAPSFYGENQMYSSYYVLFPSVVRKCVLDRKKEIKEIDKNMLRKGIDCLYHGVNLSFEKGKYAVFFIDLIERYPDRDKAEEQLEKIIHTCAENNYHILLKYHPRETNKIKNLSEPVEEIDAVVPAEKVLSSLIGNKVIVISNMSASLNSSVKLGFMGISIMGLLGVQNESAKAFYEKIGVCIPKCVDEIEDLLTSKTEG